jgi:hypothetical protein
MPPISRAELFEVLRVAAPETVLALICGAGITSRKQAVAFLGSKGFQSCIINNDETVDEAISRKADLSLLLDVVNVRKVALWRYNMECSAVDLAELYGTSLRDLEIDYILADGGNTWAFIRKVGITNVRRFWEEVLALEGVCTPDEIKSLISRADREMGNPTELRSYAMTKIERIALLARIAKNIGTEATVALRSPGVFDILAHLSSKKPDAAACYFMDSFMQSVSRCKDVKWSYGAVYEFHLDGFTAEETLQCLQQGIDARRAAGIRNESIPQSVSSGWL